LVKALDCRNSFSISGFGTVDGRTHLRALGDQDLAGMHFVGIDGTISSAGYAAIEVLAHMPAPLRWIGVAAGRWPFLGRVVRSMYIWVADRRGRFARYVPDVSPPRRR
jgi:predicted DCC family thiol-disulfide oxidoreductase YuxK